jgi:hypothetical protein
VKLSLLLATSLFVFCLASTAQDASSQSATQTSSPAPVRAEPTQTDFTSAKGFVLEEGTPVRLRLNRTISSADAHVGDTLDFEVLDDITVNRVLVIPKGD